jgi:hypothetical protein
MANAMNKLIHFYNDKAHLYKTIRGTIELGGLEKKRGIPFG